MTRMIAVAAASIQIAIVQPTTSAELAVGFGAAWMPDYEGSDDYEPVPVWSLRASGLYHPETYVQVVGSRLESNFLPDDRLRLGIVADYLFDYGDVNDNRVARLSEPEESLQTGFALGYDFSTHPGEKYLLEIEATYDVLNGNGGVITPGFRAGRPVGRRYYLSGGVAATWANGEYTSNRFGISEADAALAGLPDFDAGAGVKDVTFNLSLSYAIGGGWSLTGFTRYRRLLNDAADSPVVDSLGNADLFSGGALISYRF